MKDGATIGPDDKFAVSGYCYNPQCEEPFMLFGAYANKAAITGFLMRCHKCGADQIVKPSVPYAIIESYGKGYIE